MSNRADQIIIDSKRKQEYIEPRVRDDEAIQIDIDSMDGLAIEMCDELIKQLDTEISYNTFKAVTFKCIDNVLYITSHLISLAILVIGLYNGASVTTTDSDEDIDSTWFFVTGVLGGVNGIIVELGKRYHFNDRGNVIYSCAQEYNVIITTLRQLKIDSIPADQKMIQIKSIELDIKNIQMKVFDRQVIKSPAPTNIVSIPTT